MTSSPPLRLLVLGGTGFVGPPIVEAAIRAGHDVTLFNRGHTGASLFPDVPHLVGDRDPHMGEGLDALREGSWDVAIDVSGYLPSLVEASARVLSGRVRQYVFISSMAAYADAGRDGITENDPLHDAIPDGPETMSWDRYGPYKAACERAVNAIYGERATLLRCGYIVGPGDPFDRLTFWPVRLEHGGDVVAPGAPDDPVQIIDVRDLADFVVRCAQETLLDAYNVVGPIEPICMGELLSASARAVSSDARLHWISGNFLAQRRVRLPCWTWRGAPTRGFTTISNEKACRAGLSTRPLDETLAATLNEFRMRPASGRQPLLRRIAPQADRLLIDAWTRTRLAAGVRGR